MKVEGNQQPFTDRGVPASTGQADDEDDHGAEHSGRLGFGQLGPDDAPVVGAKISTGKFAVAFLLNTSAIHNRNSGAPPVIHRRLSQAKSLHKAGLESLLVKE